MEKIAEAVFLEPALFGFKEGEDGKLKPFTKRIPKGETGDTFIKIMTLNKTAGNIKSVDLEAAYVRLDPPTTIPGELGRVVNERGMGEFRIHYHYSVADFEKNDKVVIYKMQTKNGKDVFVVGK